MTPKQKATKLTDSFYQKLPNERYVTTSDGELSWEYNHWYNSKECALIAVDEILETLNSFDITFNYILKRDYWLEVKQEIEKL